MRCALVFVASLCVVGLLTPVAASFDAGMDESHEIAKAVGQLVESEEYENFLATIKEEEQEQGQGQGEGHSRRAHRRAEWLSQTSNTRNAGLTSKMAKTMMFKSGQLSSASNPFTTATTSSSQTVDVKAVTDGQLQQPNCAWQAFVTGGNGANINAAFPDSHCVYQVLVMTKVSEKRIFRIRGKFPTRGNRYFSLQSNNPKVGFPLATIRDFEINPDPGSGKNPYAEETAEKDVGMYTIYVTPRGNQGNLNEIALCTDDMSDAECMQVNAVMIMRYYTSDPDQGMLNSETDAPGGHDPRLFGYVAKPIVEIKNPFTGAWMPFKPCDQSRPTPLTKLIEDNFATVIPGWGTPIYPDGNNNFIMYLGLDSSTNGVYPNLDANYLVANIYKDALPTITGKYELVAKVTGVLPLTAYNMRTDPKIANYEDYEVRYNSFSTIAKLQTAPTIQSLDDSAIRRFYKNVPNWNENRTYSIVVGPSKTTTCGLYNAATDLFLTTTLPDGSVSDNFSILDRQLVPKFTRDGLPDRSITYTRFNCSAQADPQACHRPSYLQSIMKEYYPSVTWYVCKDGRLTPAFLQTLMEKYFY